MTSNEGSVRSYRFYVFIDDAFRLANAKPCANDGDAVTQAFHLASHFGGCDLWSDTRRIAFISQRRHKEN